MLNYNISISSLNIRL